MTAQALDNRQQNNPDHFDVIVVGSGPVGMRFVQQMLKLDGQCRLAIFGDEPWQPYNRVKLSSLVSGQTREEELYDAGDVSELSGVQTFYNNRIVDIDRQLKQVRDSQGHVYSYQTLILATGSRAYVPMIDGVEQSNVHTFRDLNDAQLLMGRSVRTRHTVVIGGGILGLEAARAMQRFNTEVTVIEHSMWLMFRQLDNRAGNYLKRYVETLGIHVRVSERVQRILGDGKVTGVELVGGEVIDCDTVIIAAGIVANSVLASDAGLQVGKGIRVDDQLRTSDDSIYAIGECIEHDDRMYGLVAPGFEQAAVLAHSLNGEKAQYRGSVAATHLKVLDYPVFSIGNTGASARSREVFIYQDHQQEIYRKLVVINGRIRGAVGIGDWPGVHRIQEAVEHQRRLWPWQLNRFVEEGALWADAEDENVIDWPVTATVCNCTGVTRGQLDVAHRNGAVTVMQLAEQTGASTVCGSCKNLLTDYVGGNASPEPTTGFKTVVSASLLALFAAVLLFVFPPWPYAGSVQENLRLDAFWRDGLFKQISGFTLLGISIFISLLSLRKRWRNVVKWWDFAWWRVVHVVLGALIFLVLLMHTGFRLGDNLNMYLMLVFGALLLVGTVAGLVIGYEHNLSARFAKRVRAYAIWSHILLLWPLPALLGFHILKTYYF